jgi:hypothetical protein
MNKRTLMIRWLVPMLVMLVLLTLAVLAPLALGAHAAANSTGPGLVSPFIYLPW